MLEALWAAAEIDASYLAVLRATLAPTRNPQELSRSQGPSLADLTELSYRVCGGNRHASEQVVLAWNVLYTALYILDSVEDGDVRTTSWAQWGSGPAINISTGLIASVAILLNELERAGVQLEVAQAIRTDFFQTLLKMTDGQHADLTVVAPTLEQAWQIAEAKSGSLFGLACRAGARLAGADSPVVEGLGIFGQVLGVLIQIGDDLDDFWSQESKPSDIAAGRRWMLPVAYAMTVLPAAERERLGALLHAAPHDSEAEATAQSQVIAAGAMLYLAMEARRLQGLAHGRLVQAVPDSGARNELLRLLDRYTPFKDS